MIFGPVHISDFADLSSQRFSLIQITQHFLLNAVASAALSNGAFPTGWMNRQQNFYILIESISKNSPQQLAYCRTSSVALYKTLDGYGKLFIMIIRYMASAIFTFDLC